LKLLVAFDGLAHSIFALEKAAEVAAPEGADVTVLSVVPPDARGTKSGGHVGFAPHADADVEYARRFLGARGITAAPKLAHGDPADEILREAETGAYDVLVVGTRELGAIVGTLLGSVSRKVLEHAPCPVIVAGASGARRVDPTAAAHP
jgi:nucleotide-binding universal stress UspA family protein